MTPLLQKEYTDVKHLQDRLLNKKKKIKVENCLLYIILNIKDGKVNENIHWDMFKHSLENKIS